MPEFEYHILDTTVRGVCATDATDEVIQAAILADLANALPAGQERRIEEAQVVYTIVPELGEPLNLSEAQRAELPPLEPSAPDEAAAYIAVKSELPVPESGPIGPAPAG